MKRDIVFLNTKIRKDLKILRNRAFQAKVSSNLCLVQRLDQAMLRISKCPVVYYTF